MSKLPGIQPLDPEEWILVDEAYAGQMRLRDRLIAEQRSDVLRLSAGAFEVAQELLSTVLDNIRVLPNFHVNDKGVTRPDGVEVALDFDDPLATAGRLVQEDLCIMQAQGNEHVLTGAVLCFPANWTLAEKMMRPLISIHTPIEEYDENIARRVQRLFDAIRVGRPLWRANVLYHNTADLYSPRRENDPREEAIHPAPFVRSERQCLLRLVQSDAIVFSIHTYLLRSQSLSADQAKLMAQHRG